MRRHKRKQHWKRIKESTRSKSSTNMDGPTTNGTGISSNKETVGPKANDMGRIFVTKEIESRNSVLREDDGWEKHVNFEANCGRF
jgi:hypothetical protein